MMRSTIYGLLVVVLTGCAIVASKETLKVDSASPWKMIKTGSGDYYSYRCEQLTFNVNEIIFTYKYHSYGPIIPILPSGEERNFEDRALVVNLEIAGYTKNAEYTKENLKLKIFSDDIGLSLLNQKLSKITDKHDASKGRWIQYKLNYSYDTKLRNIQKLVMKFEYPFPNCPIPDLDLTRKKMDASEFVISPGV